MGLVKFVVIVILILIVLAVLLHFVFALFAIVGPIVTLSAQSIIGGILTAVV